MRVTSEEINMNWRGYKITIPKGTRVVAQKSCSPDVTLDFVSDLRWIPMVNGNQQYGLIHDALHYGINIPSDFVIEA